MSTSGRCRSDEKHMLCVNERLQFIRNCFVKFRHYCLPFADIMPPYFNLFQLDFATPRTRFLCPQTREVVTRPYGLFRKLSAKSPVPKQVSGFSMCQSLANFAPG